MLEDIAQKLAVSTSKIIGYEVIITDEHSIIIGASDTSRLGDLHEASINIIKTGNPNPDTVDIKSLKGTKHGFALPLEILDKKVGSFGITGKREEVKGYCYLLKEYIETMLYQEMYLKSQILREQAVENLLQEIAVFDPIKQDESYILMRGQELGYDLQLPRIVIVIDFYQFKKEMETLYKEVGEHQSPQLKIQSLKQEIGKVMKDIFESIRDIIAPFQEDKFVILPTLPVIEDELDTITLVKEKCNQVIKQFEQMGLSVSIGIGTIAEGINELHQSYKAAWRALELGRKRNNSIKVYYFHDLILEDLSAFANSSLSQKYIERLLDPLKSHSDWKDLAQTICAWCESGFNQKYAANMLFIHRNTLHYRLNKIYQITNIDPMNFKKIITLYLGILMDIVNNDEI